MKLLVIGGTGLLSGAVVKEALRHRVDVTIVNRGRKSKVVPEGVNVIISDYRNKEVMQSALQGKHFDAVIDFICFNKNQIEYSVDLLSPYCTQYIFISSACVYNYELPGVKSEDDEKVLKQWEYSVNKWECECYLIEIAKKNNINYNIIRPCITYDDSRIPYGIAPAYGFHWTLVGRILAGKPIIRWNGGTTKWNMMRVEDFVVGVAGLIGNEKAYNQAYNVSGDEAYSWNDVIECVEKVIKKKAVFYDISSEEYAELAPEMKGRIFGRSNDLICNNQKIKDLVPEYKTTYDLQTGIEKTIKGYKENNYQRGIDFVFDASMDRVIRKSCKIHGINLSNYKLDFVDYLGNASIKDKLRYYAISRNIINNNKPNKMKIVLSGVETNNKGAELMLYAILQEIERRFPNAIVYIPDDRISQGTDYITTKVDFRTFPFSKIEKDLKLNAVFRILHLPYRFMPHNIAIGDVDYYLDGSGFKFSDKFKLTPKYNNFLRSQLSAFSRKGTKIVFMPQAFGPAEHTNTKDILSIISRNSSIIMPRERISYNYLKDSKVVDMNKVIMYTDFTSLVEGKFPAKYENLRNGICIIPNYKMIEKGVMTYDDYIYLLTSIIKSVNKSGHSIYLLNHEGKNDEKLAYRCQQSIGSGVEVVTGLNALEVKGLIASAYLVITSRFHGLASSLNSCVPALATSWSHKYEELYRDYGLEGFILPIENQEMAIEKIMDLLDINENNRIRKHLEQQAPKIKEQTRKMWNDIWSINSK